MNELKEMRQEREQLQQILYAHGFVNPTTHPMMPPQLANINPTKETCENVTGPPAKCRHPENWTIQTDYHSKREMRWMKIQTYHWRHNKIILVLEEDRTPAAGAGAEEAPTTRQNDRLRTSKCYSPREAYNNRRWLTRHHFLHSSPSQHSIWKH